MIGYRCRLPKWEGQTFDAPTRLDVMEWANYHCLRYHPLPILGTDFTVERLDGSLLTEADIAYFEQIRPSPEKLDEQRIARLHSLIARGARQDGTM